MNQFTPFADDEASLNLAGLTVENGRDRLAIYGNLEIARDKAGRDRAHQLKALVDAIVEFLDADGALPEALPTAAAKATTVKNPFA